jgi:hypothetical protein
MKKNIYYIFAHQDDEFGVFIDIYNNLKKNNVYIFYLTNGSNQKISKLKLSSRDKESIEVLKKIGVKEKNIFFLGRRLNIECNKLYLFIDNVYKEIVKITKNIIPSKITTLSWEGGHEDHDACNLIARKLSFKYNINKVSKEFSLYNRFKTNLIYFKVFNPINKNGTYAKINFFKRFFFIKLLFTYKSQIKVWIGLYPFIICHYLFLGYNFLQPLNKDKTIKKPHKGKLLYEFRNFCNFGTFRNKVIGFL